MSERLAGSTGPVPVHPEAVADTPDTLRWVVPAGLLEFVGRPARIPPPLQALYDDGVLVPPLILEPTAVVLRLAEEHTWRSRGPAVRQALQAALAESDGWEPPADRSGDELLRSVVAEVLAGELGEYVRGHGGRIEVVEVTDSRVTISLGGACEGCPASGLTVRSRFESAVRRRYPQLREVVTQDAPSWRGRMLRLLPTQR